MDEPRRITVVDPSRPAPLAADELDAEQPRSRRGLHLLLGALAVLAAVRVGDTVLDRRAAAAEERRLAAVVELEVTARFSGGSSSRSAEDVASVSRLVGLRNAGPRPVEVLEVSYGPLRFEGRRGIGAGRELAVELTAEADCSTRPAALALPSEALVRLRTEAGSVVERRLPLPDQVLLADAGELQRGCGYLEVFEASYVGFGAVRRQDRSVVVRLEVGNRGRTPLSLVEVGGGAGMAVDVVADAPGPVLPLVLAADDGTSPPPTQLAVVLSVADCSALQRDAQPFDGTAPGSLHTTFADEQGATTTSFTGLESGEVQALVQDVCG